MRHPFETWPSTGRRAWVWSLGAAAVAVGVALGLVARQLDEGGFLALELARSHERVGEILAAWRADGVLGLGAFGLGLDMAWALLYGLFLATVGARVAVRARAAGRTGLATAAVVAAWAAMAAGLFDILENASQVPYFDDPSAGWPQGAATFATVKFTLLAGAIVVPVVGWLLTRRA